MVGLPVSSCSVFSTGSILHPPPQPSALSPATTVDLLSVIISLPGSMPLGPGLIHTKVSVACRAVHVSLPPLRRWKFTKRTCRGVILSQWLSRWMGLRACASLLGVAAAVECAWARDAPQCALLYRAVPTGCAAPVSVVPRPVNLAFSLRGIQAIL